MAEVKKTSQNGDFQKYDKQLSKNMAMDSLRNSLLTKDILTIEAAIVTCEKLGLAEDPKVEEVTNSFLPKLVAKKELQNACERRDREAIEACLEKMEENVTLCNGLFVEINKARILLDLLSEQQRLQQQHRRKTQAIELNGKALSEMRRYHKPPPLLHKIVQAGMLLLGENEDLTDDWKYCQRLCNPHGSNSLSRRLAKFQPEAVHVEIVARAKQILSERDPDRTQGDLDLEKVETIGAGTGLAFYVWTRAAIEKAETARRTARQKGQKGQKKGQSEVPMTPVEPANRKRQKELLAGQHQNASGNTILSSTRSSVVAVAPATERRPGRDHQIGDRTLAQSGTYTPRGNLFQSQQHR